MPTQEQRRTTTKNGIIAAAFETFKTHGGVDVSLESIADRAGVTKGSIHYHFGNRAGLMTAVALWLFTAIEERIASQIKASGRRRTASLYVTHLLAEQASPAGRVLFTIGDALEQQAGLGEVNPYHYLCDKLRHLGVTGSVEVMAAAVMQLGRQLAYGEANKDHIDTMVKSLRKRSSLLKT
ncbi:MAG: TetR/AcrR family transcriptional regulator [Pseudomonadota bacterium]